LTGFLKKFRIAKYSRRLLQIVLFMDQIGAVKDQLDELIDGLQDVGAHVLKLNTGKIQAITREQLRSEDKRAVIRDEMEKASEKPGGWYEFRKQWLFPVVMMVISALVSAGLTYIVVSAP
jgi:hypothetical protein